jgi:hypothetical protein
LAKGENNIWSARLTEIDFYLQYKIFISALNQSISASAAHRNAPDGKLRGPSAMNKYSSIINNLGCLINLL